MVVFWKKINTSLISVCRALLGWQVVLKKVFFILGFFFQLSPDSSAMKNQNYTQILKQVKPNIMKAENMTNRQNKTCLVEDPQNLSKIKKPLLLMLANVGHGFNYYFVKRWCSEMHFLRRKEVTIPLQW